MFNIGDYVTRNSYNNDIVFRIIDKVTNERVGLVYYSITKEEYLRTK